jgi:hypothetical protein
MGQSLICSLRYPMLSFMASSKTSVGADPAKVRPLWNLIKSVQRGVYTHPPPPFLQRRWLCQHRALRPEQRVSWLLLRKGALRSHCSLLSFLLLFLCLDEFGTTPQKLLLNQMSTGSTRSTVYDCSYVCAFLWSVVYYC